MTSSLVKLFKIPVKYFLFLPGVTLLCCSMKVRAKPFVRHMNTERHRHRDRFTRHIQAVTDLDSQQTERGTGRHRGAEVGNSNLGLPWLMIPRRSDFKFIFLNVTLRHY